MSWRPLPIQFNHSFQFNGSTLMRQVGKIDFHRYDKCPKGESPTKQKQTEARLLIRRPPISTSRHHRHLHSAGSRDSAASQWPSGTTAAALRQIIIIIMIAHVELQLIVAAKWILCLFVCILVCLYPSHWRCCALRLALLTARLPGRLPGPKRARDSQRRTFHKEAKLLVGCETRLIIIII